MLCFLCEGYGVVPEEHWARIWNPDEADPTQSTHVMFGNHDSLRELQQSAAKGCHLCNLVLASLEEAAQIAKKSLDSFKSNAVTLHVWLDRTRDLITGDQRDECRIDPICTPVKIEHIPAMLQGRSAMTAAYIKGELRCSLAPRIAKHVGSSITNTDTSSEEAFQNLVGWWNDCMNTHKTCRQIYKTLQPMPTRVIWVGKTGSTSCRLVETGHCKGFYVALSHCWGKAQPLTTTRATLRQRMRSIADSELPLTFRHAVELCRRMEIPALWIDSLCIIQDSAEDWRAEAAVMGNVYSHAHCTFAASAAADSSAGLFWPRNGLAISPLQTMLFSKACIIERHPGHMAEVFGDFRLDGIGPMPLVTRAWVLQEQIFSPRTLGFTSEGLLWNCSELRASERHPFGLPGVPQRRMDVWAGLKDIINKTGIYVGMPQDRLYGLWYRNAMDYNRRSLTKSTDVFPAISALAQAFSDSVDGDMYLAGLWAGDIHTGLLWRVDGLWRASREAPERLRSRTNYPAPSWSWASAVEWIWYDHIVPSLDLDEKVFVEQKADFLGVKIDPVHQDFAYGELAVARLGVHGPLIETRLHADQAEGVSKWSLRPYKNIPSRTLNVVPHSTETSNRFSHCYFDDESPAPGLYTCALITTTTSTIPDHETRVRHWALILEVVGPKSDNWYRRAGLCEINDDEIVVFDNVKKSTYVLI